MKKRTHEKSSWKFSARITFKEEGMKYLGNYGTLPNKIDRETPNECQYTHEWTVWEVYQCDNCGEIYEDKPQECDKCDCTEFSAVEETIQEY